MFIQQEDVDYIEARLQRHGIFQHGLPLGIDFFDITTNSKDLDEFIRSLRQKIEAAEAEGSKQTGKETRALMAELQGLPDKKESDWELLQSWVSASKWKGSYQQVYTWRNKQDGTYRSRIRPFCYATARAQMLLATCVIRSNCSLAKTEQVAHERLLTELDDRQRDQYVLTDSFVEAGKSGVLYMLRRNRPTLAIRPAPRQGKEHEADLLCALCMHPLAYYTGSWAGVMPPSDEILAHLLHIRSSEHRYWKVCHQHKPSDYLSGL